MNPEWKEKWLAALRSGEYRQGHKCLKDTDDKFCCLGVLCDITGLGKWEPFDLQNWYKIGDKTEANWLPDAVNELTGFKDDDEVSCAFWNDEEKLSFAEIANRIEEKF